MKSLHVLACAAIVAASVILHGGDTATAQPPAAKFTPPSVIQARLPDGKVERILPGYFDFKLEMSYDIVTAEKTGQLRLFTLRRPILSADKRWEVASWIMESYEVAQSELVPIAGSLYRWDQEKWELYRVDAGPIAVEKMFDRAILTSSIRIGSVKDGLQIDRVRFGEPVGETEADSVDLRIYGKGLRIGERKIDDDERSTEPYKLKRGDIIATAEWEVKVSRILRPDPATKHPGWVEFAVTHRPAK